MNDELHHSDADELQAHLAEVQDLLARQKLVEEHLHYISIHDALTGLYNRFYADA